MTKKEAREMLEKFYTQKISTQIDAGLNPKLTLPIKDEIVSNRINSKNGRTVTEVWTFIGLMKLIYDL